MGRKKRLRVEGLQPKDFGAGKKYLLYFFNGALHLEQLFLT
jgi:hypothetical protein